MIDDFFFAGHVCQNSYLAVMTAVVQTEISIVMNPTVGSLAHQQTA